MPRKGDHESIELTPEFQAEADAWADARLAGRTPDERWALLRELMEPVRAVKERFEARHAELLWQEQWRGFTLDDMVDQLHRELREAEPDPREHAMRCLRLEVVLKRVAPHVTRARFSRGLTPRTDLDRWIHTERLRDAAHVRRPA